MSIILDGTTGITTPAETVSGAVTAATVTATGLISGATNYTGFKNLLIDAGFTINQRSYVSAATLASGSYGHDRWKAGASGGNYTFTQLASSTTITIASGKSLIQVVEDKNVNGTSFVLSWTGTAQARFAVNSATPSGSYAASPILITGQTVGTTMSVEFNTGTLTNPQLELGSTATSFDCRDYGRELIMCQRYYQLVSNIIASGNTTTQLAATAPFQTPMRSAPSLGAQGVICVSDGTSDFLQSSSAANSINTDSNSAIFLLPNFTSTVAKQVYIGYRLNPNSNKIILSAEL